MSALAKLKQLGITLPPWPPAAAYVPFVQTGQLVFISGNIARKDNKAWVGQLGLTMETDEGKEAARSIAIALMGTLQAACQASGKTLDDVKRIVKVMSLVNSAPPSPNSTWSPTAAASCWARSSGRRSARMRAAPSAWRSSPWGPAWRSS